MLEKNWIDMEKDGEIIIYRSPKGEIEIETQIKSESIWLSQKQIAELFSTERSVITKHLRNIFSSGELEEKSNVQKMHIASSDRPVNLYSLDAIISVGYRVNSIKATDFRIWSTRILKKYLTKGYALNEKRLRAESSYFRDLKRILQLISKQSKTPPLKGHESELLKVITDFSKSWKLLSDYDQDEIKLKDQKKTKYKINFYLFRDLVFSLKTDPAGLDLTDLFDPESSNSFEKLISDLEQKVELTLEEQAALLFYNTIKSKPFPDGNKRIASFLLLYFLQKNNYLFRKDGSLKINDKTIATLALLVDASTPEEKKSIQKLIINLIQE